MWLQFRGFYLYIAYVPGVKRLVWLFVKCGLDVLLLLCWVLWIRRDVRCCCFGDCFMFILF